MCKMNFLKTEKIKTQNRASFTMFNLFTAVFMHET